MQYSDQQIQAMENRKSQLTVNAKSYYVTSLFEAMFAVPVLGYSLSNIFDGGSIPGAIVGTIIGACAANGCIVSLLKANHFQRRASDLEDKIWEIKTLDYSTPLQNTEKTTDGISSTPK